VKAGGVAEKEAKISEEMLTSLTLESLEKDKEGVTEYPVLNFDQRALNLLCTGVKETLKYSKVKPAGGMAYKAVKHFLDIVLSLSGLIILLVPMIVVAVIIFVDDHGNPFFSQVRLTENGKPFKMYKFRYMCMDAEARFAEVQKKNQSDGIAFKSDEDPRITKIGRFIRKTSIDELPQLFNILKGDMSLIGPRPGQAQNEEYLKEARLSQEYNPYIVKPGLGGYAQVNLKRHHDPIAKSKLDSDYVKNICFYLDIKLFLKTFIFAVKSIFIKD
jgi:lipopolysaccharide/colanic/teichoic acid biosynthesis glycosyltransferase